MNAPARPAAARAVARAAVLALTLALPGPPAPAQEQAGAGGMAEMMAKARKYTEPGEHHKLLEKFLGTWDLELRITMPGAAMPPGRGTAEVTWLHPGRWIQMRQSAPMMGRPTDFFSIMGYDNFKMSYVVTSVTTLDTAMPRMEGDLDPRGDVLIMYGTIDEYLTGEHDKMVKSIFRLVGDDKIVNEVHDLAIGESDTKVVEITYTRRDGED